MPAIFHRARTTCPLFSYTEYIASLNFCLLLAYVIARYSASLASRILTSRPTYAEKLQGYKNLSPRSNTLPLAGHANTSFLTFAVPKKNLIHVFSGHWPLFFAFFVDILAIFCTTMQISLRIRYSAPELCPMHLKNVVSARPEQTCIFHRLTRLLCCPVACIYNMPNKIPKRRFF